MAQTPLFKKLILDVTDASSEVSQPVAMNGDNTVQCAVQIMALTGTTPTATFLHQVRWTSRTGSHWAPPRRERVQLQ